MSDDERDSQAGIASSAGASLATAANLAAGAAASVGKAGTPRLAPDFRVRVNGAPLPPAALADLVAVSVVDELDVPSMFTLRLITWDMRLARMTWADSPLFNEGGGVEIAMGYEGRVSVLMQGEITGLELDFSAGEVPMLTVRGYDPRHRLLRGQSTRSFVKMKDSDIARQVAASCGLAVKAVDTGVALDYVLQHNQSDLEFLRERAQRIGYEIAVDGRQLHFRPRRVDQPAVYSIAHDEDLIEFTPRLTSFGRVGDLTVRGWSPKDKRELVGKAGQLDQAAMGGRRGPPGRAGGKAHIVTRPVASQAEADMVARGQLNERALAYIGGSGLCLGRPELRAGAVVEIAGLGRRFSGPYYLTAVTHRYLPRSGYQTSFEARRNSS